jgi:preprotein translocase subunit SecG
MRLQIETKIKPQHASRLNRVVFGVALLWLATSLLLLMLYRAGSAHDQHPNQDSHQQFAHLVRQAAARASLIY